MARLRESRKHRWALRGLRPRICVAVAPPPLLDNPVEAWAIAVVEVFEGDAGVGFRFACEHRIAADGGALTGQ